MLPKTAERGDLLPLEKKKKKEVIAFVSLVNSKFHLLLFLFSCFIQWHDFYRKLPGMTESSFFPLVWFLFIVSKNTWEFFFFFNLASDSFPAPLVNLASAILISSLTLCLPPILTLLQSGSLQPTSWPTGFYLASTVIFFKIEFECL